MVTIGGILYAAMSGLSALRESFNAPPPRQLVATPFSGDKEQPGKNDDTSGGMDGIRDNLRPEAVRNALKEAMNRAVEQQSDQTLPARKGQTDDGTPAPALTRDLALSAREIAPIVESLDEGRIAALNEVLTRLDQRLERMENQLAEIAAAPASGNGQAFSLSLVAAVDRLQQAVGDGRPFERELSVVADMIDNHPRAAQPLTILRSFAAHGLSQRRELERQFTLNATAWATASPGVQEDSSNPQKSFGQRLVQSLSPWVRVRKTGALSGETPEARIARAERYLLENDLGAAGTEIAPLPIPAAQNWAREATGRARSEQALEELYALAVPRL